MKDINSNSVPQQDKQMSVEESLRIITDAIRRSQQNFQKRSGTPILIWGCTVLLFSLIVFAGLWFTQDPRWNLAWFGIPVAGGVLCLLVAKGEFEKVKGEDFIDKTINKVWIFFGILAIAVGILAAVTHMDCTTPIILLLAMGCAVTGALCNSRVMSVLGIVSGIAGMLVVPALTSFVYLPLVMAGAAILDLIVPGLVLNMKNRS